MRETRQFRGISLRLAVQYLETLGGERVDADGVDPSGSDDASDDRDGAADDRGEAEEAAGDAVEDADPDPVRIEGDDWSAALTAETVQPVGSITLTEVTIDFEGDPAAVEPLVEAFARKAMRAGG